MVRVKHIVGTKPVFVQIGQFNQDKLSMLVVLNIKEEFTVQLKDSIPFFTRGCSTRHWHDSLKLVVKDNVKLERDFPRGHVEHKRDERGVIG